MYKSNGRKNSHTKEGSNLRHCAKAQGCETHFLQMGVKGKSHAYGLVGRYKAQLIVWGFSR